MAAVSTVVLTMVKKAATKAAVQIATRPSETMTSVLKFVGVACVPIILVPALITALFTKVPSIFAAAPSATGNNETKTVIQQYVKLEESLTDYATGKADKMADNIEANIRSELKTPSPSPSPVAIQNPIPTGAGITPTAAPAAPTIKFVRNISVTVPTWRVLLALATVYNGQDFAKASIPYIRTLVQPKIVYETEIEREVTKNTITYTINIDTSCEAVDELALSVKSLNTTLKDAEKSALADGYYDFLCYYDEDGDPLKNPYYDVSDGGDLSTDYPIVTNPYCVSMPYFNQGDRKWNYVNGKKLVLYAPDRTVQSSGCGPTSMAMVIWALASKTDPQVKLSVNPVTVFNYAIKHGYYKGKGSSASLFPAIGEEYGIKVKFWKATPQRIVEALQKGHPVIAHMGIPGTTWGGGHFLVLIGITPEGKVIINDPGWRTRTFDRSGKHIQWDINKIVESAKAVFAECYVEGE